MHSIKSESATHKIFSADSLSLYVSTLCHGRSRDAKTPSMSKHAHDHTDNHDSATGARITSSRSFHLCSVLVVVWHSLMRYLPFVGSRISTWPSSYRPERLLLNAVKFESIAKLAKEGQPANAGHEGQVAHKASATWRTVRRS